MSRAIVAVLALIILATAGVSALDVALEDAAGDRVVVENETWTANISNVTILNNSGITGAYYNDTVSVYNSTADPDTELAAGSDYRWYASNGTVKALQGGALDNGTEANITYGWRNTTSEQRAMSNVASLAPRVLVLIIPLLAVILFLLFMGGG